MKNFIFSRDGQFSVYGGVLVAGDIEAYRIGIDMGCDTSDMTAMAVCQENGEYNAEFEALGNRIFVTLASSMYSTQGFINIRLAVSRGDSVITAKEIRFRVAPPNNSETLAQNESGTISDILTAVYDAKSAAESALSQFEGCALKEDTYTKKEIDRKISSVFRYKGATEHYSSLPSNAAIGDVYNIRSALKTKAYGMNVSRVKCDAFALDTETAISTQLCYMFVDEPSGFTAGKSMVMFDNGGKRIGGFTVQAAASDSIYENRVNTQGLGKICDILYNQHKNTVVSSSQYDVGVGEKFYFTGLPESDDCIDVTIVDAGDNVVWNGYEWDVLSGTADLSDFATAKDVAAMIDSAVSGALEGDY